LGIDSGEGAGVMHDTIIIVNRCTAESMNDSRSA
jgi:hypothetical protein